MREANPGQLDVDRISNPSGPIARLWDGPAHMNFIMSTKKKEVVLGAVHCGREIAPGLFAETVETGRFLIRIKAGADHAKRVGEVCGGAAAAGKSRFQAITMKGATVAIKSSLKAAALALAAKSNVITSTTAVPFITARGTQ